MVTVTKVMVDGVVLVWFVPFSMVVVVVVGWEFEGWIR